MAKKKELELINDNDEDQENQVISTNNNNEDEPIIEYNNKTKESYLKNKLVVPDNVLNTQESNFISQVDTTNKQKGIERTVTKIVRIKAIDYTTKNKERKEFLYYYENWNGYDWQGNRIAPVTDHVEGIYQQQITDKVIQKNKVVGFKRTGQQQVYYIPFSKEKVDEIIENSVGSDKETIIFTFLNGPLGYEFPYDVFVNSTYDELSSMLVAPGGPRAVLTQKQAQASQAQAAQSQLIKAVETDPVPKPPKSEDENKKLEQIVEELDKPVLKEENNQDKPKQDREEFLKEELKKATPDNKIKPRFEPEKVK